MDVDEVHVAEAHFLGLGVHAGHKGLLVAGDAIGQGDHGVVSGDDHAGVNELFHRVDFPFFGLVDAAVHGRRRVVDGDRIFHADFAFVHGVHDAVDGHELCGGGEAHRRVGVKFLVNGAGFVISDDVAF